MKRSNARPAGKSNRLGPEERRRQIVRVAAALFIKQGYLKTTVRQIARDCGINVATLYSHIKSKEDILTSFLEVAAFALQKATEEILLDSSQMPPREALLALIKRYLLFIEDIQDITVFWYQETRHLNEDQRKALLLGEERCAEIFGRVITQGCAAGEFKVDDVTLASHSMVVLCDMWAFRRWFFRKRYTLEQYTGELTKLITEGLSGAPS